MTILSPEILWAEQSFGSQHAIQPSVRHLRIVNGPLAKKRPNRNVSARLVACQHGDGHGLGTAHVGTRRPDTKSTTSIPQGQK